MTPFEDSDFLSIIKEDDVESLVELGLTKEEKLMAIYRAIEEGSLNILKFLLQHVDPRECPFNLLSFASEKKNTIAVKELCSRHAWKREAIEDAYNHALKNQSYDVVNTIYFATGHWSNPER